MILLIMYVVTGATFALILINYILGAKLYKEPSNAAYFSNVGHYNTIKKREIMASPKYIVSLSILLGVFLGIYVFLSKITSFNSLIEWFIIFTLFALYLIEISRKISINDEYLELEKLFSPIQKIPLNKIDGMYVYSYNKKFLEKRALTTKLVIVSGNEKYKFTLSSIDIKSVINMMKDNFGIAENKMYVASKSNIML